MAFAAEEAGQILSQDAQGRVLVTRERRASLLAEYDRSGMSGVKFAQYIGVKYSTLAYWLQRRRQQRQKEKSLVKLYGANEPAMHYAMLTVPARAGSSACESNGSCNGGTSPDASCQRVRWAKPSAMH
jgi:hypothetical protein